MSGQRHPVTTDAWEWLEKGEGRERPEEQRVRIQGILVELDRALQELDSGWPTPAPLPEDYWESAQ